MQVPDINSYDKMGDLQAKSNNTGLSISNMLARQKDIIRALVHFPSILHKYVHYRGDIPVEFRGASIRIPQVPFISYNDKDICCILDKIGGISGNNDACKYLNISALGTRGKIGVPYIIEEYDNTEMVVKISKINKLYSKYRHDPPSSLRAIDSIGIRECISNVKLSHIRYIASDEFTNETLIAFVLNFIADEFSLPPLYVRHYQGAICSNSETGETFGLNIMENCDLGSLDKLPKHPNFSQYIKRYKITDYGRELLGPLVDANIIFQILTQVTVGLHMLQTYAEFISGDLKAGNIFVKSDPIDTNYMGVLLKAPFTCKIADYGKSSCMVPKLGSIENFRIRFYNQSTLANVYLTIHPFDPDINKSHDEYYYTTGNLLISQLYTRTRHMGIPFYRSFDYYTVLVSVLTNPAFYYMFFSNENLKRVFWDPIWMNSVESTEAFKRIRQYVIEGTVTGLSDAMNILKGIGLKCRAISIVMDKLVKLTTSINT